MKVTITETVEYDLKPCAEPGQNISRIELIEKSKELGALKGKANAERLRDKPEIQAILKQGYYICFVDDDGVVWCLYWFIGQACLPRRGLDDRFLSNDLLVCPSK